CDMLREKGITPCISAGHSLGEYSALFAAGSLRFSDGVSLVRKRGRFMQEAVPVGAGAMAAVIGLGKEAIDDICKKISGNGSSIVQPANYNSPEQTVIAGEKEAVEKAVKTMQEMGAKKVIMLPVSAPFHTPLMKPAEDKLSVELDKVGFSELKFPVITNVDAKEIKSGDEARGALKRQVSSPVRWVESMGLMVSHKIDTVIEIGPGKVLSGLMKRFNRDIKCLNVEDMKSLEKTLNELSI
ncbi:MAG: ACP S-malonyltransferase, partial [Nitrospinae bacterium]|nr:ACP S-malonyltransferase [Nitrospinota bacterium]